MNEKIATVNIERLAHSILSTIYFDLIPSYETQKAMHDDFMKSFFNEKITISISKKGVRMTWTPKGTKIKFSRALDFDKVINHFMEDYQQWRIKKHEQKKERH